ncbi:MAG: antibiotic biosynthesis monooxygenase [Ktedonobacteraceae bacterium]|nr:antibiotic biosynthesis monooxygenase [Ktedonobacteraceae bacterium]
MIVIAGKATIRPEHWDQAVQQTQQMSAKSEAEPGCRSYRFYVELTNRNTFFIFEEWDNAEALMNHFQSTHYQEFGTFLASVLAAPPDIQRYEVSGVAPL